MLAAACLLAMSAPVSAAWLEARTDHFIVYSEGKERAVRDFASRLERFDQGMRIIRGLPDRPEDRANPLTVYVVDNQEAVRKLCAGGRSINKSGCGEVAGFYQGHVEGSVAFTPRYSGNGNKLDLSAQIVLFHEYSHHVMLANFSAAYPEWFVEGFAEFNSTARFDKDGIIGFGVAAMHRAYGLVYGTSMPIEELLTGETGKMNGEKSDVFYGRGWLLTHYLTFSETRDGQLAKYLNAVNSGVSSLDAARSAFGDLKTLDKELDTYLKGKFSYIPLPVPELDDSRVIVRTLTPGEQAMMLIRMQSDRGVDKESAATLVAQARLLAQPFPNDPGAQLALAEAEYDAGNDDLAEAAADRVLAAKPDSYGALLYKGRVRMRRAGKAGLSDDAQWKQIRNWFIKANHVQPNGAEPLWLFYSSFRTQRIMPTRNAVAGLRRAFELVPQDPNVRFGLAQQYLNDNQLADARVILAPLAYDPHAGADNFARELIDLIDKKDVPGLRAAMRGEKPKGDEEAPGD